MTLSEEIASATCRLRFEDLPRSTVEQAKLFLMDTIGVALAGIRAEGVAGILGLIDEFAGAPQATILGTGRKAPCPQAALANSLLAHSRDFDDLYEAGGAHVNITVVPAALAAAEAGGGVDGRRLLTALIAGVDMVCRLGLCVPVYRGWHVSATFGVFGAALAAGLIMGLKPPELVNALGLAYSRAAGTRQGRLEGTLAKRLQPALACESGVMCALLARKGLTGPKEWLEGMWGMAKVYGKNHGDLSSDSIEALRQGLGSRFLGDELSFKLYPCCKVTHTAIEAALALAEENDLHAHEVKDVVVNVSQGAYDTVGHPFQIRSDPQVDAQFSIPYTVALALTDRQVSLAGFEVDRIQDPHLRDLAQKIVVSVDPRMKDESPNMVNLAAKVTIHTRRDKTLSKSLDMCKGNPANPASPEEVIAKFRSCARYGGSLSEDRIDAAVTTLRGLEKIEDVNDLMNLL
jgi:2-methylcitrate dehydratase PrpD